MTSFRTSWNHTKAHLRRAHASAGSPPLASFQEYLEHDELELAAEVLANFGEEQGDLAPSLWEALHDADESMSHDAGSKRSRLRSYEARHGFVEARLTLTATDDGGRSQAVFTDYRPDWNIGHRTDTGQIEINGAPITLEDALSIPLGGTGLVRLHPLYRRAWAHVRPGDVIALHEGSRVVGSAVVQKVTLREQE